TCSEGAAIASTPSSPIVAPSKARREMRSWSQHAANGTTQIGVENASTDARPGGKIVNARPVNAEYAPNCSAPETTTSGQSDSGGTASSRRMATSANREHAAMT